MSLDSLLAKCYEIREAARPVLRDYDLVVEPFRVALRGAGENWFAAAIQAMSDHPTAAEGLAGTIIMCACADHHEALEQQAGGVAQ